MYKVLIVDDQKISRQYFEHVIYDLPGFEVAFSLDSADIADVYCATGKIDLVIMDVVMADGSDGLTAAAKIKKVSRYTKVIIVTSMPDTVILKRAKDIGVDSFWYKEISEIPLGDVAVRTMNGESVYPDNVPVAKIGNATIDEFRDIELKILRLVATGKTNEEIAQELACAPQTVKNKITSILNKTGYPNRTVLALEARISGFIALV